MNLDTYREIFERWQLQRGLSILLVLLLAFLLLRAVRLAAAKMKSVAKSSFPKDRQAEQRLITLVEIFHSVARLTILIVAGMIVLGEIGVNLTPIIASAGILGLTVGFGAQSLIRDVISGFFILLENHYAVGDQVTLLDKTGTVELMTLRATMIRDDEGTAHFIPNGEIKTVTVHSKEWSRAVIDVEVAYPQDADRVIALVAEVCEGLARESAVVTAQPAIVGVQRLDRTGYSLRAIVRTQPGRNHEVARELRRRILAEFKSRGIQLPTPPVIPKPPDQPQT